MKTPNLFVSTVLMSVLLSGGCCTTKTLVSADGNAATGVVGGSIEVTACTPMEKEVASQLAQLSDWYRAHWDGCGTNSDAAACRAEVSKAYQEQQQLLLNVLASMNGKPKAEQEQTSYAEKNSTGPKTVLELLAIWMATQGLPVRVENG
jgi:hypothetical protein